MDAVSMLSVLIQKLKAELSNCFKCFCCTIKKKGLRSSNPYSPNVQISSEQTQKRIFLLMACEYKLRSDSFDSVWQKLCIINKGEAVIYSLFSAKTEFIDLYYAVTRCTVPISKEHLCLPPKDCSTIIGNGMRNFPYGNL